MRAIHKRYNVNVIHRKRYSDMDPLLYRLQDDIATEDLETTESVSRYDEIRQQNSLSNYSLRRTCIGTGIFVAIIILMFILYWCGGNTERPTKHNNSLSNKTLIANNDKIIMRATVALIATLLIAITANICLCVHFRSVLEIGESNILPPKPLRKIFNSYRITV